MKIEIIPANVELATDYQEPLNNMELEVGCPLAEFSARKNIAFERKVRAVKARSEKKFSEKFIKDLKDLAVGVVLRTAYGK